jgi:hypothetical protein
MAASKQASPAIIAVAVVVVLLLLGGVWYKTLGPGSQPAASTAQPDPNMPPQGPMGGPPGGMAPGSMPPGSMPPGGMTPPGR